MNSQNQQLKKSKEQEVLDAFVTIGCKTPGRKKRLINSLIGTLINRDKDEQPDFVFLVNRQNEEKVIVGIEHFRTDHISSEQIKNKGKKSEKRTRASLNKILEYEIKNDEDFSEVFNSENYSTFEQCLNKFWFKYQCNLNKVTYKSFIDDFKFHLSNHLKKIKVYKDNLEKLRKEYGADNTELCFLLEIHVEFNKYLIIENGEVNYGRQNINNKFIYFDEFVDELEKIDNQALDYIFIIAGNSEFLGSKNISVEALKVGNIRNQLLKKNHKIYRYAGADRFYDDLDINITLEEGTENYLLNKQVNKNIFLQSVVKSGLILLECINKHENFVTNTEDLQFFLEHPDVLCFLKTINKKDD